LKAIVLGGRPGNIGGAIAERLRQDKDNFVHMDDCLHQPSHTVANYYPPLPAELSGYDACVITLGATHMGEMGALSADDIHKVIYGSLELPLQCVNNYVKGRREIHDTGGQIIMIGSFAHDHVFTNCTAYCAAKAGLEMASKSLAWELMPDFSVHTIHPHHVQGTPMTDEVQKGMMKGVHKMTREEANAYQRKDLRMPDIIKPEAVAEMVHLLLTQPVAKWLVGGGLNFYGGVR
jgi:NAD(P)-dependent dehydrogenase (short-subunit alcohol dehydrogenase family)